MSMVAEVRKAIVLVSSGCMGKYGVSFRSKPSLAIVLWLIAGALALYGLDVKSLPKPTGYVSDLTHVLSDTDRQDLERACGDIEKQIGVQVALVTVNTIDPQPVEDFSAQLARQWRVGDKKTNSGVLVLLVIQDRKNDIELGRGIEPFISDGFTGTALRSVRPQLREQQYGAALRTLTLTIAQEIAQHKGVTYTPDSALAPSGSAGTNGGLPGGMMPAAPQGQPRDEPAPPSRGGGFPFWLILLGIFFLVWLMGRGNRRGPGGGGGGGGFLTGMVLGNLLSGGRGSNWGGGGFGGGNDGGSSGGGGFGGFGGGDFGGGGANSDW